MRLVIQVYYVKGSSRREAGACLDGDDSVVSRVKVARDVD